MEKGYTQTPLTRLLLVEDNPGDVRLIREMLREAPGQAFELRVEEDLAGAIDRLEQGGIDLVLADMGLPDSYGMETFTRLNAKAPRVPIILLTNLDSEKLAMDAVREGAQDYLVKRQVYAPLLVRAIRYAIARKKTEEELKRHRERLEELVDTRTSELNRTIEHLKHTIAERDKMKDAETRAKRALLTLYQANEAMVRASNEDDLLRNACKILVDSGGYMFSWIGYKMDDPGCTVKPICQAGFEEGYLEKANITWADVERGASPCGVAIRTGKTGICQNILDDPAFLPWREEARKRGYASSLALPLFHDGHTLGALMVYAPEADAFAEEEVKLLSQLAEDLSFGITAMRAREAHQKAEEELRLQRAMAVREDRLRSLGEMAAGMAHELNQPLVGIRGMAEHIQIALDRGWDMDYPKIKENMATIIGQADRMTFVIDHVRQFSRGPANVEMLPVNVNAVVDSSMVVIGFNVKKLGLTVKLDMAPNLPPVMANPYSLEEVIINLLTNARDAIMEKIQSDPACPTEIRINTSLREGDGGKTVVISVTDEGIGIPESVMPNIFTPFFTTKENSKGTGLGLAICKSIVSRFNGKISVSSKPGKGTSIEIALPAI